MKFFYTTLLFCFITTVTFSQNKNRVEISGQIISDSTNLEAITVFNLISKIGTTTDKEGKFVIDVSENDILQISAIQFQEVKITIDENIIRTKEMTIVLVEELNQLNEVLIFSSDLSGILNGDIEGTTILRPNYDALYFGIENKEEFLFAEDFTTKIENSAEYGTTFRNGVDFVGLAAGLVGLIKKSISKPKSKSNNFEREVVYKHISDAYSNEYLTDNLNIETTEVTSFIIFVEENGFDISLLKKENEFLFLEFMNQQKIAYQKSKND